LLLAACCGGLLLGACLGVPAGWRELLELVLLGQCGWWPLSGLLSA
jgi:hypothetical protein